MSDKQKASEKVWAKVTPPTRLAIEALSAQTDRTVSHITRRILELDPATLKQYREVLKAVAA